MIKLGQTVTDKLSGFTGTAFSRVECLSGPPQIGIVPRSESNSPPSIYYVDEDRLLLTAKELAMVKGGDTMLLDPPKPDGE